MAKRVSHRWEHRTVAALLRSVANAHVTEGASGLVAVSFTCANPGHLVGIVCDHVQFTFVGSGSAMFPEGTHEVFFKVKGSGKTYDITCAGGTLDFPMKGTFSAKGTASGIRTLTAAKQATK